MGNTCKPMAVSFQCMTKSTTNKKNKIKMVKDLKKKGGVLGGFKAGIRDNMGTFSYIRDAERKKS